MDITPVEDIAPDTTEARGGISTAHGEVIGTPTTTVGGAAAIGGGNRHAGGASEATYIGPRGL